MSSEVSKILVHLKYEKLPDGLVLIPISKNKANALEKITVELLQRNIQYSVDKISIEDLFNKIYGK